MIVPLAAAEPATCGGKAGTLGALLRAGFPVPDGFVVPHTAQDGPGLTEALARALDRLGDPPVAVRSSAAHEDGHERSAAGAHDSFLAVRGAQAVAAAVRACRASLRSPRLLVRASGAMAVLVQRHVDAEVSGVMFTTDPVRIEASWGLGPSVVGGTVTPDSYLVGGDAVTGGTVTRTVARKAVRLDRDGDRLVTREVPPADRDRPVLDDPTAIRLAGLGRDLAGLLGGPQDVEWALTGGRIRILQSRPVTAALPEPVTGATGAPGSPGTATGPARVVRGPADFARVRPGDVLVCPFTDPAWTPLLRVAAAVVTETGGVLSHAAIVARELGIPAVLGVPGATTTVRDGVPVTVDGTAGTVRQEARQGATQEARRGARRGKE